MLESVVPGADVFLRIDTLGEAEWEVYASVDLERAIATTIIDFDQCSAYGKTDFGFRGYGDGDRLPIRVLAGRGGDWRPRVFCPSCGALVVDWDIDGKGDRDRWVWHAANAEVNAARELPGSPLQMVGKPLEHDSRVPLENDSLNLARARTQPAGMDGRAIATAFRNRTTRTSTACASAGTPTSSTPCSCSRSRPAPKRHQARQHPLLRPDGFLVHGCVLRIDEALMRATGAEA